MKLFISIVILAVFLDVITAKKISQGKEKRSHSDNAEQYIAVESYDGHGGGEKRGYSIGSGLRSIAQGSAHQAHSAVANQAAAGIQASYVAKNTLAQAAIQAAATAHAALAGKHVLLQELEHQLAEAQYALEAELAQLQLAQYAAAAAKQTAQQAASHVAILSSALNSAQELSEAGAQAAHKSEQELASQTAMVGKAKQRLNIIGEQLNSARIDYEATKAATEKATAAAHEAQSNAAAAGVHAQIGLQEAASKQANNLGGEEHHQVSSYEYQDAHQQYHH